MPRQKSIAIFCGSSSGFDAAHAEAARAMGRAIVERDLRLVYGAGSVGLMGIIADEVLAGGGEVLGVIPQFLVDMEVGHPGLSEMIVTTTMHERKLAMAEAAHGFIALPGGIGTLEEIIEVFTWTQLGLHRKRCGLLNVAGYYDHLLGLLDHMVSAGFLKGAHAGAMRVSDDARRLLKEVLDEGADEVVGKWVG